MNRFRAFFLLSVFLFPLLAGAPPANSQLSLFRKASPEKKQRDTSYDHIPLHSRITVLFKNGDKVTGTLSDRAAGVNLIVKTDQGTLNIISINSISGIIQHKPEVSPADISTLPELKGPRPAIAIPDLFSHQLSPGEMGVLSDKVRGFMTETSYFKVLSDPDMKNILRAQDFNVSDRCDDAICLAEMGKILKVEKVVGGTVGKLGKRFSLSLRMVDVESGEILHHVNRDIECPLEQLLDVMQLLAYELAREYAEGAGETPA